VYPQSGGFMHLTKTEIQIVQALAKGENAHSIADHRFRSQETIKQHIKNAREKLGAKTYGQLIYLALKQGLINSVFAVLITAQFLPDEHDKARVRVSSVLRTGRVKEDLV